MIESGYAATDNTDNVGFTIVSHQMWKVASKAGAAYAFVYSLLFRYSVGFHRTDCSLSLRRLADECNMNKETAGIAIKALEKLGMIKVEKRGKMTHIYHLQGLVMTQSSGFQYSKSFLLSLGITVKQKTQLVRKPRTDCTDIPDTPVRETRTFKDKKEILKDNGFAAFGTSSNFTEETAEKIWNSISRFGRSRYSEAVDYAGGTVAAKVIKQYGWDKLCNADPKNAHFILAELKKLVRAAA